MPQIPINRESLLKMAQQCAKAADRKKGMPVLEEAGDMLEQAAFRVAELEDKLARWESFGTRMRELMPPQETP